MGGEVTHHEVPIYGLYPDYENRVTISAGEESSTFTVTTEKLPSDMLDVSRVAGSPQSQQAGQLYLLQSPYQVAFDVNGDVRWCLTEEWSTDDCPYSFSFDGEGTGFWASRNPLTGSVYNWGCEVFHMTWTGRVDFLHSGASDAYVHHAGCVGPNGEYLYFAGNQVYALNSDTGVASLWLNFDKMFDSSQGAINVETGGNTADPWHTNSIQYLPEDDSVVISFRNQQMVLKIGYSSKNLEWVFTNASGVDEAGNDWTRLECDPELVIHPAEDDKNFEWFFDQHDSNVISYDAQTGIMRLAIFDNGTYRYNYGEYPNDVKHSRMVVYEIDEKTGTARQIYQYGKERGVELHSQWYGSTRYIPETDHYVGCFRKYNDSLKSHVVETDAAGNVVAEYQVENAPNGVYRAYPVNLSLMEVPSLNLCSNDGVEKHEYTPNYWSKKDISEVALQVDAMFSMLFRDENSVSVSGTLKLPDGTRMDSPQLVVRGSKGTYVFNLVNSSDSAGIFYGRGIDVSSLPDDVYSISVITQLTDGRLIEAQTGKTIAIGNGEESEIEITSSIPDESQQQQLFDLADQARSHGFDDAVLVQDPFGVSPLTAALCFNTDSLSSVRVVVHGKTSDADVAYNIDGSRRTHIIPVWGLYYNDTTLVTIACTDASGESREKELSVTTGEAPEIAKMPQITCTINDEFADQIAPGLTFCATIGSYHLAVDKYGDVRWYYSDPSSLGDSGITFNDQQHLLVLSPKPASAATNTFSLMEMDLLGRTYKEYFIDGSFHHEVKLMKNGNILCAASKQGKKTINDFIVELNPETGDVVRSWGIDEILSSYGVELVADPVWEYPTLADDSGSDYTKNWFHDNCIYYDESDDSFILSSRHRSMVVKLNASTNEVNWVLGDHALLEDTGLAPYLLTPVDGEGNEIPNDEFEWQYAQHAPTVTENGDVLLFDNGDHRSRFSEDAISADKNYSRMVSYHVDEEKMTVSTAWQFGKELGSEHYCTYVGDADELGQDHYLGTFGGHFIDADGVASDAMTGINVASLFEVVDDTIVWQLDTVPNDPIRSSGIYRSERVEITELAYSYDELSGIQWLGSLSGTAIDDGIDLASFSLGDAGVSITSINNEGNRVTVSGALDDGVQANYVYFYLAAASKSYVFSADVAAEGALSCGMVLPSGYVAQDASLYVLVERVDGSRVRQRVPYQASQTDAFSLTVAGESRMSVDETVQLTALLSPGLVLDDVVE